MKKKLISIILSSAMVVSMLVACGNVNNDEPKEENSVSKVENSVQKSEVEKDVEEVKEPEVLTVWDEWLPTATYDYYNDREELPHYIKLQEATGIDLQFIDSTGGSEAMGLLIASNDLPDIIIGSSYYFANGVQGAVADGTLIPLNEFLDAGLMPNLKAVLDARPEVDKLIKTDDGVYTHAPMIRGEDAVLNFEGIIIRQDWLDDLGLDTPENLEDLEEVLRAFKNEKGSTGLIFSWKSYLRFQQSFGFMLKNMYVDENGKVQYGYLSDGYEEFLTLFRSWYDEGLIDPDAFTMDRDTFLSKIATGEAGVAEGYLGGEFNAILPMQEENPEMNWVALPMLGKDAETEFAFNPNDPIVVSGKGAYITANCENPELAARFLDYYYSEEGSYLNSVGIEGESFEFVNGELRLTENILHHPDGLSLTNALHLYSGNGSRPGVYSGAAQKAQYTAEVQIEAMEIWECKSENVPFTMPEVSFTTEEQEEYNFIMAEINTYAGEFNLKLLLGTESMDQLPEFREALKKMNIDRAIEIYQNAYDRFASR